VLFIFCHVYKSWLNGFAVLLIPPVVPHGVIGAVGKFTGAFLRDTGSNCTLSLQLQLPLMAFTVNMT